MNRIKWLDVSKGIGVILVIFGHLFRIYGVMFTWISSFHMPLFFFCSGYVFNPYSDFKNYLYRKMKSLIIPYLVICVIGAVFTLIIPYYRSQFSIKSLLIGLLFGQPDEINVGPIWFLLSLFWVEILFYCIFKLLKKNNYLILISTIIITYIIKYIPILFPARLPLNLDTSIIGLLFYELGYLFKIISKSINEDKKMNFILAVFFFIVSLLSIREPYIYINGLHYNEKYYEFLFFAIIGIGMVVSISKVLESCEYLNYLGKNSLYIFGIHSIIIRTYQLVYKCIFDKEIHNMIDMTYFQILMCGIFTIISTSLISNVYVRIKSKIHRKIIS